MSEKHKEKYYVSDAAGGKEVEIPVRQDPFESILAKPEAQKAEEVVVNDTLAAGDDLALKSKDAFAGKEEALVVEPEEKKEITYGHCNNCRLELTETRVVKQPIEFERAEDGSYTKTATRFSVFCKQCMKFITLIDQEAVKMLDEMIHKNVKR
jgi:nitrous oxide reductase